MRFETPPVVKNLILINIIFFIAQTFLPDGNGEKLTELLSLHYFGSSLFYPHQFITHMFLHANFTHLFANMFALWMFGRILEYDLGSKRLLTFYMVCGIGAGLLHSGVAAWEMAGMRDAVAAFMNTPTPELLDSFVRDYFPNRSEAVDQFILNWYNNPDNMGYAVEGKALVARMETLKLDVPTVGASGAVFGVLLAFGMLHPNDRIMLLIPPIPLKAKYFVIAYGVLELFLGFAQSNSNVAHFAHVGGMLFGFILLYLWKKQGKIYY